MTNTFSHGAVILGHNRPEDLRTVLNGIAPQVSVILVIDNASNPPLHEFFPDKRDIHPNIVFLRDSLQPPNLSYLWNIGLEWMQQNLLGAWVDPTAARWKVAMLTDDVVIPDGWMQSVADAMDFTGAVAGCSSGFEGRLTQQVFKTHPDSDIANRMYGPAFVLRGESGIRANEKLLWWYNDTWLDWEARRLGGMVMIPGPYVHNKYPDASTVGERAEQAGRDREKFKELMGWLPW